MASNPSDGMQPSGHQDREAVRMTHCDLHEVTWKAQLLAHAARSALGTADSPGAGVGEAQAVLDLLWRVGFRPSDEE